jgi:anthranilate synthase component 2
MKLLMIDNYDSFTYNIVQYFGELGASVEVFRNDEITLEEIAQRAPDRSFCACSFAPWRQPWASPMNN